MFNYSVPNLATSTRKVWPYEEYYIGEKDEDERRSGHGENHWSGAESLEWYTGQFLRDTMHGPGDYRWRFLGEQGSFITYEGHFYANRMHGYGTMSYPDGKVFTGLYHGDWRWVPGVMSHPNGDEDVGLWRGSQLVRLTWTPDPPEMSLIPDFFDIPRGREFVGPQRLVLASSVKTVDKTRLELCNCKLETVEPLDTKRQVCCTEPCFDNRMLRHTELFEDAYYGKEIQNLNEIDTVSEGNKACSATETVKTGDNVVYYSWNKNFIPLHMMKHCFKHEHQRSSVGLDLTKVMSGPREGFKPPGEHERSCRLLLMASYLGQIADVIRLLNEENIYTDVADMLGNTALMYAACGNQHEVMRYLVVAGAGVDSYNDAGLTPLGMVLMMYVGTQHDYTTFNLIRGVLPPETQQSVNSPSGEEPPIRMISEWHMVRGSQPQPAPKGLDVHSKIYRSRSVLEKPKSLVTLKSVFSSRPSMLHKFVTTSSLKFKKERSRSVLKVTRSAPLLEVATILELCRKEEQIYKNISLEYKKTVNELFSAGARPPQMPYLFEFQNMEAQTQQKMTLKASSKKSLSKLKLSKGISEHDETFEKNKRDKLIRIHSTIEQLLSDGADPRLVRCPQPALVMAMAAESADLLRLLLKKGADVNETYPQFSGLTPLDIAISGPLRRDSAELVRALLENKASVDHRLPHKGKHDNESGPTLLHILISKEPANEILIEARNDILEMLLEWGCDAYALFNGSSVVDTVVTSKNLTLLDLFIKSLDGNLNRPINSLNQSLLVKMFTVPCFKLFTSEERVRILTSLLVHGADPLLECQNESETYPNMLAYALKSFQENFKKHKFSSPKVGSKSPSPSPTRKSSSRKSDQKIELDKSEEKKEKGDKKRKVKKVPPQGLSQKQSPSSTKHFSEGVYKAALDLVSDWARMMHINWIQVTLMEELVQVVNKFKHRSWHLIIRDHKNRDNVCLWLSTSRCLELWDMLKATKQDVYKDNKVLKFLLCIVQYYKMRQNEETKFTFREKELLEGDVIKLLHEHKITAAELTRASVKKHRAVPKLDVDNENKFNVCFECSQPLSISPLLCDLCGLVSFCNVTCLIETCTRGAQCHPCSDHLTGVICPKFQDTSLIYSGASGPSPSGYLQHGNSNKGNNERKRQSKPSYSRP